jgi:tetratricopeptide (TPR) repeat protein
MIQWSNRGSSFRVSFESMPLVANQQAGRFTMAAHAASITAELEERVSRNPQSSAFPRLADSYRLAGDLPKAIAICSEALMAWPDNITGRLVLGRCYLEQNSFDLAIDEFKAVCRIDRHNLAAIKMLADIFSKHGQEQQAGDLYRLLARKSPENQSIAHLCSVFRGSGSTDLFSIIGLQAADSAPVSRSAPAYTPMPTPGASDDEFDPAAFAAAAESLTAPTASDEEPMVTGDDVSQRMDKIFPSAVPYDGGSKTEVFDRKKMDSVLDVVDEGAQAMAELQELVSGNDVNDRLDEIFPDGATAAPAADFSSETRIGGAQAEAPVDEQLANATIDISSDEASAQDFSSTQFADSVGETLVLDRDDIAGLSVDATSQIDAPPSGADVSTRLNEFYTASPSDLVGETLVLDRDDVAALSVDATSEIDAPPSGADVSTRRDELYTALPSDSAGETLVLDRDDVAGLSVDATSQIDTPPSGADVSTRLDELFTAFPSDSAGETMVLDQGDFPALSVDAAPTDGIETAVTGDDVSDRLASMFSDETIAQPPEPVELSGETMAFDRTAFITPDKPSGAVVSGADVADRLDGLSGGIQESEMLATDETLKFDRTAFTVAEEPSDDAVSGADVSDRIEAMFCGIDAMEAVPGPLSMGETSSPDRVEPGETLPELAPDRDTPTGSDVSERLDAMFGATEIMGAAAGRNPAIDRSEPDQPFEEPIDADADIPSGADIRDRLDALFETASTSDDRTSVGEPIMRDHGELMTPLENPFGDESPQEEIPVGIDDSIDSAASDETIQFDRMTGIVSSAQTDPVEPETMDASSFSLKPTGTESEEIDSRWSIPGASSQLLETSEIAGHFQEIDESLVEPYQAKLPDPTTPDESSAASELLFDVSATASSDDESGSAGPGSVAGQPESMAILSESVVEFDIESAPEPGITAQESADDLLATVEDTPDRPEEPLSALEQPAAAVDVDSGTMAELSESSMDDSETTHTTAIPDHVLTPTLADIYFQQGQPHLAIQIYQRLLRMNPENEKIQARIARIEQFLAENSEKTAPEQRGSNIAFFEAAPAAKVVQPVPVARKKRTADPKEGLPLKGKRIKKSVKERLRTTRTPKNDL